jgi:hypothetical protein
MTEAEWLACEDLGRILKAVATHHRAAASLRKHTLYTCACFRSVWGSLDGASREKVEAAERSAERPFTAADAGLRVWDLFGGPMPYCPIEEAPHAALLRDIFGNPFRPATFDPSWRTDTVTALATQMYESRDFGAMPILADALQDAGCDSDDILSHCRDTKQVHVRGCWVVDLVLGKE